MRRGAGCGVLAARFRLVGEVAKPQFDGQADDAALKPKALKWSTLVDAPFTPRAWQGKCETAVDQRSRERRVDDIAFGAAGKRQVLRDLGPPSAASAVP